MVLVHLSRRWNGRWNPDQFNLCYAKNPAMTNEESKYIIRLNFRPDYLPFNQLNLLGDTLNTFAP